MRELATVGLGLACAAAVGAQIAPSAASVQATRAAGLTAESGNLPLIPLTLPGIATVLQRAVGKPTAAPSTIGYVDLRDRRVYVAEYQLLIEVGGEIGIPAGAISLLDHRSGPKPPSFVYSTEPDIAALQALTDRVWADLQARLRDSGVVLSSAAQIKSVYGAVNDATAPASAPGAPVFAVVRTEDGWRRYLVLSPTGMKLVPRDADNIVIDSSNPGKREAYLASGVEAISLTVAVNLSGFDPQVDPVFHVVGGTGITLVPRLELRPLPGRPLLLTQAGRQQVALDEVVVAAGGFGRIRLRPREAAERPTPTGALRAVFEQDGPAMADLMMLCLGTANQAIAKVMRLAQQSHQPPLKSLADSPGQDARPGL